MSKYSVGDKVKIVFPFKTNQDGKIYKVYKKDGQLGIDYRPEQSAFYPVYGSFTPLSAFVSGIIKRVDALDFLDNMGWDEDTKNFLYRILNSAKKCDSLAYQFLGRLQADCNYYLGYGKRRDSVLWFLNEKNHITFMFYLWASFPADSKPEWLTFGDLMYYEKEILKE